MLDENIVWGCCKKMCMRMLHDNFIRMLHENVVCESWMRMFFENVVWEYCMRMLYEMRMLNEKEGWKNFEIYNGPNIVIYFIIQKPWYLALFFRKWLMIDTPSPRDADASKNDFD